MSIARNLAAGFVATLCLAGIGGAASAQNNSQAPAPRQCAVSVDRSQDAGVFNVTRQELADGNCVCVVQTGPSTQGQGVENQIASLRQSRQCASARVVQVPQNAPGGMGFLNGSGALVAAGMVAGGAGLIALIDNIDNDPRPLSP